MEFSGIFKSQKKLKLEGEARKINWKKFSNFGKICDFKEIISKMNGKTNKKDNKNKMIL